MSKAEIFRVIQENDKAMLMDAEGNFYEDEIAEKFACGDIIRIAGEQVRSLYDAQEHYGTIFITNHCNSNCMMCPDSDSFRSMESDYNLERILQYIFLLPEDIGGLDITGGEPTLITYDLPVIVQAVYEKGGYLPVMLLSNGRSFADKSYTRQFQKFAKRGFYVEIPIHGSTAELHDRITRGKGGFLQTMEGIKNLVHARIKVGIRLVVTKINYQDLKTIIHLVSRRFPQISYINIMGMECLGNAYSNREQVWIEFEQVKEVVEEAVEECMKLGIKPHLYNFPLCLFQEKYWGCYRKSISPGKVRYLGECEGCGVQKECGGFFHSTSKITKFKPERRMLHAKLL